MAFSRLQSTKIRFSLKILKSYYDADRVTVVFREFFGKVVSSKIFLISLETASFIRILVSFFEKVKPLTSFSSECEAVFI